MCYGSRERVTVGGPALLCSHILPEARTHGIRVGHAGVDVAISTGGYLPLKIPAPARCDFPLWVLKGSRIL